MYLSSKVCVLYWYWRYLDLYLLGIGSNSDAKSCSIAHHAHRSPFSLFSEAPAPMCEKKKTSKFKLRPISLVPVRKR